MGNKIILSLFMLPAILFSDDKPYIKLAQKIRSQHIKEMNQKGFNSVLVGGGMFNDVEEIALWFQLNAAPTLEEARILYLRGAEKLLDSLNQDKTIRPYLHDYPFTIKNLDYCLKFKKTVEPSSSEPISIYRVSCLSGQIHYWVSDTNPMNVNSQKAYHIEPYEQALRMVGGSKALAQSKNKKMR